MFNLHPKKIFKLLCFLGACCDISIGAALLISTAVSAAGQVYTGISQASAAKEAARAQERAAASARAQAAEFRAQTRNDQLAQIQAGQAATRAIANTGFVPGPGESADFNAAGLEGPALSKDVDLDDPFVQQRLELGTRSINQNLAALGQRFSGLNAQLVSDLTTRITGEETNKRRQELQFLSSQGSNSASQVGSTGAQLTGSAINATIAGGSAQAAGITGSAAGISNAVSGATGAIAGGIGDLAQNATNLAVINTQRERAGLPPIDDIKF